jgi:hypothetical protein
MVGAEQVGEHVRLPRIDYGLQWLAFYKLAKFLLTAPSYYM